MLAFGADYRALGVGSGCMRIDNDSWLRLQNQLATSVGNPPTAVFLAIHALLGSARIVEGYAETDFGEASTVWRNWVVTDSHLIAHTNVDFAQDNYDSSTEEESYRRNPEHQVVTTVHDAWVRPLKSATSLRFGDVGRLRKVWNTDWFPIGQIILTFADGASIAVPGQENVDRHDRDKSDRFVAALRAGMAF
jgi:hypothetical protein